MCAKNRRNWCCHRLHLQHCSGGWEKDKEHAGILGWWCAPANEKEPQTAVRALWWSSTGTSQSSRALTSENKAEEVHVRHGEMGNKNKSDFCKLLGKMFLQVFWIPNLAALKSHWIRAGFLCQKKFSSQLLQTNTVGIPKGPFSPRFKDESCAHSAHRSMWVISPSSFSLSWALLLPQLGLNLKHESDGTELCASAQHTKCNSWGFISVSVSPRAD